MEAEIGVGVGGGDEVAVVLEEDVGAAVAEFVGGLGGVLVKREVVGGEAVAEDVAGQWSRLIWARRWRRRFGKLMGARGPWTG